MREFSLEYTLTFQFFTMAGKETMRRLGLPWKLYSLSLFRKLKIYRKTRKN